MNHDEIQLYQEWKGFLQQSSRFDVRYAAIQAVLEHPNTVPDDLWIQGVIPLIHFDEDATIQHNQITYMALQCLQYKTTTAVPEWVDLLWTRLIELALSAPPKVVQPQQQQQLTLWRQCVNVTCALLANLSRDEAGAIALVGTILPEEAVYRWQQPSDEQEKDDEEEEKRNEIQEKDGTTLTTTRVKPTLELLLSRYLSMQYIHTESQGKNHQYLQDEEENQEDDSQDPYQHLANVWMNITQVELGRKFLLQLHSTKQSSSSTTTATTTTTSVLQRLLPELQSINSIRRCGIAGMCRNICISESDSVDWLLHTVQITTHLLWPLVGPEELDLDEKQGLDPQLWLLIGPEKQRETNVQTRLYIVEAILGLLKTNRMARHVLRLRRVYVILKYADMVEEDELVSEQIYECVNYLRGDEEGLGEGSSDRAVSAAYPELQGSRMIVPTHPHDFDQVD